MGGGGLVLHLWIVMGRSVGVDGEGDMYMYIHTYRYKHMEETEIRRAGGADVENKAHVSSTVFDVSLVVSYDALKGRDAHRRQVIVVPMMPV